MPEDFTQLLASLDVGVSILLFIFVLNFQKQTLSLMAPIIQDIIAKTIASSDQKWESLLASVVTAEKERREQLLEIIRTIEDDRLKTIQEILTTWAAVEDANDNN